MKSKNGKYTELFGEWLTESLGNSRYTVYYDQGDKQKEPMVAAIKGFLGKKVTNVNRLADNDVMVVNDKNEIILLIEIEEVKMSPKKLLGDIFTIEMCNRFAVRINKENKYFDVSSKTRLIVAGVVPNTGSGQKKIRDIILPRLKNFSVPSDAVKTDQINIITGRDISETIDQLKGEMKSIFGFG